jgi:NADH-quinone oxidoreductase subunit J
MTLSVSTALFWGLAAVAVAGALAVVIVRDVMRMALGLGAFFLAVAGFFAFYGFGFLALAELFVYVGGVLVLILFAIMLVHRSSAGGPVLESRWGVGALATCVAVGSLLVAALLPVTSLLRADTVTVAPAEFSALLLGRMLPQFEAVGVLLLAALAAVVVIMAGDRE